MEAVSLHNRAGITGGGTIYLYRPPLCDIPNISTGDSEADLAVSGRISTVREWKFPAPVQVDSTLVEAAGGSETLARLLVKRGLRNPGGVRAFLDPDVYQSTPPSELKDIGRAVARVKEAIAKAEKITVYGDYDVDGVTATAVMVTTLRALGAQVDYYIPTRSEGYGLNLKAVSVLASRQRTKLIITCDCGISNFSEINFARSLGVETIVVDHHSMPEMLPPAAAILHPKQLDEEHPLYHLPGVGVAYKFAEALLEDAGDAAPWQADELLDFVTLGMIADMVPLVRECRYLVQIGMPRLIATKRAGLRALLTQVGGSDGGTDLVGFGLAPRINAVGRLSDANTAVKLMCTDDETEASELARQLEYENLRRQELCEEIFVKADQAAQKFVQRGDKAIAVYGEGWHHGVVGIVASRLVEKYHCPTFVGELDPSEGIVKGSARGIEAIDVYQVLKANEHLTLKWGGHKMAAGFSVEVAKADLLCQGIVDTCNRLLADKSMVPTLEVDLELPADEVNMDLASLLSKLAPFGIGNKKPVIAMRGLRCVDTRPLGKEGKHSRIMVADTELGLQFECVYWSSRGRVPALDQIVDVAFAPEINTYNGNSRLQLVLTDWRDPSQPVPPAAVPRPLPGARLVATGEPAPLSARPESQQSSPEEPDNMAAGTARVPRAEPQQSSAEDPDHVAAGTARVPRAEPQQSSPEDPDHMAAGTARVPRAPQSEFDASPERTINWKDLRTHTAPASLVEAARRKLGDAINIFAEGCKLEGHSLLDRTGLQTSKHLLLWQYPPSMQVLHQMIERSSASTIYLVGGAPHSPEDATTFLKRLTGLVRFAVNQREGQADPDKLAAALSTSKMAIALGLTILKKINLIDWFAEDGCVYLDIIGQPEGNPEQMPEFRQLTNCLRDVLEFRKWCHQATTSELQLALVSAAGGTSKPSNDAPEAEVLAGIQETMSMTSAEFST